MEPLYTCGEDTKLWHPHLSNIGKCVIGRGCTIHSHVWIGDNVKIGNWVRIQAFTFIPPGVTIGDHVFLGPRVTFTNDKHPPSLHWSETKVENYAVIGAGAVILPGLTIGAHSVVGAGAVVTRSVPPHSLVVGNPARLVEIRIAAE